MTRTNEGHLGPEHYCHRCGSQRLSIQWSRELQRCPESRQWMCFQFQTKDKMSISTTFWFKNRMECTYRCHASHGRAIRVVIITVFLEYFCRLGKRPTDGGLGREEWQGLLLSVCEIAHVIGISGFLYLAMRLLKRVKRNIIITNHFHTSVISLECQH